MVGSKHFLVETADKNLADPPVVHPDHGHGHGHGIADAKLRSPLDKTGEDYWKRKGVNFWPRQHRR